MKREANGMAVVENFMRTSGHVKEGEAWVHGMWTPRCWRACLKALLSGRRLVRMTHGSLSPVYLRYQSPLKKRLVAPIERWLFARCDRVVVTGDWERTWCEQWGVKGPFEIVDLKRFFNLPTDASGQRALPKGRPLHLLYLGRRHPLKGLNVLESAIQAISQSPNSPITLRIVSDAFGEEKERVWAWCDVLVLPTLSENFGLVVAEALERGKRVITTDGAPAWEGQPGVVYLKGYRDGTDARRVELLLQTIREICGGSL